ncbi:20147_t:CDS:2, partial [Gigaspora margarita]
DWTISLESRSSLEENLDKKIGFEPSQTGISINFDNKGYDLPTLDNLQKNLKNNRNMEVDKLYT